MLMFPFNAYPGSGRQLLGMQKGSNARQEYGAKLMQLSGQKRCAYCDSDLTSSYPAWLTLVVDHVVPINLCKSSQIREEWCWDYSNAVLACAACNGFCNRYVPSFGIVPPETLEAFYDLRDKIFEERKILIAARHEEEQTVFTRKPWESEETKRG